MTDNIGSANNIFQQFSSRMLLDENVAIRLYNSVSLNNVPQTRTESLLSVCSSNELGHSCRICRWNRNDLPIQQCPCMCKGSVGYIHLKCLRRWIIHRNSDRCEICGAPFILQLEKCNYRKLFWSFFQAKYFGAILTNCGQLASIAPVSYVILYQVLQLMDNIQFEGQNTLQIVFFSPVLLLTSSIIFFHILEFSITRCLVIKNTFKHWWNLGGQDSDPGLDSEVPSEVFEFF